MSQQSLQKAATIAQLIATAIALAIPLGASVWSLAMRVERHEWWISEHTKYTMEKKEALVEITRVLGELKMQNARLEERMTEMRDLLHAQRR